MLEELLAFPVFRIQQDPGMDKISFKNTSLLGLQIYPVDSKINIKS